MKQKIILGSIFFLLIISLSINGILMSEFNKTYLQLNATRLDPPGLQAYPTALQPGIANDERHLVVFFGDSRAAQWRTPSNTQDFNFVNRGIGAQTSTQVLQRFDAHIRPLQPDILILQVGINDLKTLPLFPQAQIHIVNRCKENIEMIVGQATEMGSTVIVTTIFPTGRVPLERRPYWSADIETAVHEMNVFMQSLESEQVILFDSYALLADKNGRLAKPYAHDELHLTTVGYTHLNKALIPVLDAAKSS